MIEKFDIYNAQKVKIGTGHPRGTALPKGQYRFVATVVIYNSKGELLLQKRTAMKKSWANYWTFGASGSVIAGETVAEGARRELLEELGLDIDLMEVPSRLTVSFDEGWDEIWIIKHDAALSDLTLQAEEVSEAAWFGREDYFRLLENNQAIPHVYAREIFDYIESNDEYLPQKK